MATLIRTSRRTAPERGRAPLPWLFLLAAALGAAGAPARTEELQDHGAIQAAAEELMTREVEAPPEGRSEIHAGRLDPRLRLAACEEALEAFLPPSGRTAGNTTVGVRCNGEHPWTLYIPVRVSLYAPVLVATRPLARGTLLGADDITLAERDVGTMNGGYLSDPQRALGHLLKRAVSAQATLSPRMLDAPHLVEKGKRVVLVAAIGGVEVRVSGTALDDGALGDQIKVRNLSSQRVVEGRVVDQGTVQVDL